MKFFQLLVVMLFTITLSAQSVQLTFRVDMSEQNVSPSGVHVAGTFQVPAGYPNNWDPSTVQLFDADGDNIYEATVLVPPNTYLFKYVNADNWGGAELPTPDCSVFDGRTAAQGVMELSAWGNAYLQESAPWALYKANPEDPAIRDIMFVGLQVVALLSLLTAPFIPFTSPKLRRLVGLPELEAGDLQKALDLLETGAPLLPSGHAIGEPELLFAKIIDRKDDSRLQLINRQKEKLEAIEQEKKAQERDPIKENIEFDDFTKLDLRTGTITAAEKIPKANKLLKLTVDLGNEVRTVVSGIAKFYKPEELPGQGVVLVANLAPRKLRGVESQGMVLMAENSEGQLVFVQPKEGFGNGWTVR